VILRRLSVPVLCAASAQAQAHGFGQRYDLPLPLSLYICGAALTVIVSCVMLFVFVREVPRDRAYPRLELLAFVPTRLLASAPMVAAIRLAAVALYLLLLAAGFLGNQNAFHNVVPITIWALWWVGLAYFSALIGDLWKIANPLEVLFAAAEHAYSRIWRGRRLSLGLAAPPWMAAWPAVVIYLAFLWAEMVWDGSDSPRRLATLIVAYSVLTWTGMWVFGREAWLEHGEAITRVFGVFARFSPMGIRLKDRRILEWELRPYAVALLTREPVHTSEIVLVMIILAAVSFDGFLETPAWASLAEALSDGGEPVAALRTAGLLVTPLLFLGVYLTFSHLIARSGRSRGDSTDMRQATRRISGLFVPTLVPISIAYQIAHYLSFLAIAGQYMIALVSDPFGWGWNLFGTANHLVRPGIIDARLVWIISVAAIVVGHVAALYLSHMQSMREFADRRAAARSQLPMLALMVAYTMLSLWIIAQPIVTSR
jgi:hypothetical protein